MHFWIDKQSQGCGFSGRHLVPPSLSGYGHSQRLCGGFHPKPMVTPVHRFQSIESVVNSGLRYGRSSACNYRIPVQYQSNVHQNGNSTNVQNNSQMRRSLEMITSSQTHTPAPHQNTIPTAKLKCGVWIFFAIVTFFLAGAKYYFHGINIGMEAFAFCSLLVIILIIGGLVSLYEAITTAANAPQGVNMAVTSLMEQQEEDINNQVPRSLIPPSSAELPPPPYHIAIMLPSQANAETVQVIHDSPPPSYEKAIT